MTEIPEEWRDISGFEGMYQVSSLGRVRALRRDVVKKFPHAVGQTDVKPAELSISALFDLLGGEAAA